MRVRGKLTTFAVVGAVAAMLAVTPTAGAETRITPVAGQPGVYTVTGPDAAIKRYDWCQNGETCFFSEADGGGIGSGTKAFWRAPCGYSVAPNDFRNRATSAWNRRNAAAEIFYYPDWTGSMGVIPGGWQGNLAPEDNDGMDSVYVYC
ncbi:peptidase inhibitor family I36 protein [Streptomyces sp. NPDC087440]|uniref:peptidase inhibitor family I36 protein n=1 Tax=Streptomyces sp. NPDC087440 TaxID=3365790 RepID=UPI00380579C9